MLTRSKTRYVAERDAAFAHMKSLYAATAAAVETWEKCAVVAEIIRFVLGNHHMNELLETDTLFRRTAYDKCNELLATPNCTTTLIHNCAVLRLKINRISART